MPVDPLSVPKADPTLVFFNSKLINEKSKCVQTVGSNPWNTQAKTNSFYFESKIDLSDYLSYPYGAETTTNSLLLFTRVNNNLDLLYSVDNWINLYNWGKYDTDDENFGKRLTVPCAAWVSYAANDTLSFYCYLYKKESTDAIYLGSGTFIASTSGPPVDPNEWNKNKADTCK